MSKTNNVCCSQYSHPYEFELERFVPPKEQLTSVEPRMYNSLENTPLHYISTVEGVNSLLADLKKYKEIAVDLEVSILQYFLHFFERRSLNLKILNFIF